MQRPRIESFHAANAQTCVLCEIDMTDQYQQLLRQQAIWEARANEAQGQAAHAYARLLRMAQSDTGQASRVRRFLAASFNGDRYMFDLFDLRALDPDISDDVPICMDALRWARADLYKLVPNGYELIVQLLQDWQMDAAHGQPSQGR